MATKKVNIDIVARDKSKQALNRVRGNLDGVKKSVFNLRNAFIGLGAGLVIRSIINTGKEIENLQVRLKFLFGTAEEGAKAFDEMAKFASKVPFSLAEIQKGAGVLAVVSKDAEELAKNMKLTGNVAAVTGLDFKTTAEQIQRSLSAGISAADLFRDRGVKAMLGFKAGATVSIEETVEAFDRVFGAGGKFDGATDELAKTFEGTLSMIGDKVFNFKRVLLEAGFFPELKKQFGDLNKFMEENQVVLDNFATQIGEGLAVAVVQLGKGLKFVKEHNDDFILGMKIIISLKIASVFMGIAKGVLNVAKATMALAAGTSALKKGFLGIVGLFATGGIGYLVFKQIDKLFDNFLDQINEAGSGKGFDSLGKQLASMGLIAKEANFNIQNIIDSLKKEQKAIEKQKQVYYEFYLGKRRLANILAKEEKENLDRSIIAHKQYGQTRLLGIELDFQKERELQQNNFHKMLDQNQAHLAAEAELKKQFKEHTISEARSTLEILAGINENAFKVFKALRIAEATINTYSAAVAAFYKFGGWPFGVIAAAATIAKGMAMVAQINAQSYSGREHGGAVTKGKPYMVGEAGREMFVPNQSGNIVPNDQLGGKAVTVNFNINTVDARGFNELLVNSRGVIVNMINSAVNEKGRMAIV